MNSSLLSTSSVVIATESFSSTSNSNWMLTPGGDDDDDDLRASPIPCSNGWFFFIVYGPLYAATCGFGLVGNCLSFGVLHHYSQSGNVSTFLLKSLAVSDNIFLSAAAFVQMYPALAIFVGATDHLKAVYPWYQMIAWPVAHMVQLGTVWMMVLVASNRYMAVCQPLHAQRLCTKGKVQVQIALIAVFSILYNVPRFVEYRYVYRNVTDSVDNSTKLLEQNFGLASHPVYNIIYENIAYCLFAFLLPLSVLIFFNTHLLRALKNSQRLRRTIRKGKRTSDENNVTLVMVVIIISFILCQTPASANQVLYYTTDTVSKTTCSLYMMYYHLSNLLITVNSSSNFIIYCLFRRQFQQQLRSLIGCASTFDGCTTPSLPQWRAKAPLSEPTRTEPVGRQNTALSASASVASVGVCQASVAVIDCQHRQGRRCQ